MDPEAFAPITLQVGRVEVIALMDAIGDTGPMTEMFPRSPADGLLAYKDRHPAIYGEDDAWRIHVRTWLLRHPDGLLLLDTGLGKAEWFPGEGRLQEALAEVGVDPGTIDTVAISHVHDDHLGAAVLPDGTPAFPNARLVIQSADVEALEAWAEESEEDRGIWDGQLRPLMDAGLVDRIDGDHRLSDALHLQHLPGHTPGHQVLHVEDGGTHLIITADTWNHPAQLAHPEWPSGADADDAAAAAARRAFLPVVTSDPSIVIAPTHFDRPFGSVTNDANGEPMFVAHTV